MCAATSSGVCSITSSGLTATPGDGARFAWLVNPAAEQVIVQPRLAHRLALTPLDGGARQDVVTVAPFGVSVLRLDDATVAG
jgi:hypothetical protein